MSLEWKSCKIGDVVSVRRGSSPRPIKDFISETGMPWVKIADATSDQTRFINSTNEFIKEEGIEKSVVVTPGDLIVSNSATPGLPKFMNIKACVHDGWLVFDNYNGVLKEFLYYYFIVVRGRLVNQANGSVFKNLKTDIVRDFDINLPDLKTQEKIVNILSQIDKKIELNMAINKNLEELMQVLYKRYFIELNPFYVDNDEKWKIIKLKDLVIRNRDKIKTFDEWKDELLIDLSNMPRFSIAISNFDKGEKFTSNIYRLNKYDLLFGSIRPYFGKVGFSPINGVVTGTVHSFKPVDDIYYSLILSLISSKTFINYTVSVSKGTKMPSVKWDDFIDYEFAIPEDINKIEEYNCLVLPLIHKIEKNVLEIQRLTNLRDTLLPKLMSGEIDVSKINCDFKNYITNFFKTLQISLTEVLNMKTKIISKIQNQMKPYLNQGQYLKLTNSLLNSLQDIDIIDKNNELSEIDNFKLLNLFLSAKQVEGCSDKTITYYKSTIEKMLMKIKKQVYNINTDDLRKYLFDHKHEKQSSKTTIDNIRRIFSSFFSWLEDEDYIIKNPVRRIHRVKTGRVVKEVLTDENLEILRDNCEEIRDLAIVELLTSTGIRVGELVRLNIEDINFYERECIVFGKGESERIVYFDARTKIHLIEYLQERNDKNPALFVSLNKPYERLGISGVETRLRDLGKKCNINKVHPHKFRRTMATNAIDKGMPIEQVQKLLGHVQIDTTMQYAMVNQSNVKLAHRKFIG